MKAVRIHSFGGPEQLKLEDVPQPEPEAEEVLVKVHAAGVNPVDRAVRAGYLKERVFHRLPLTLGWDLAGTVEYRGPGVKKFGPGDEVFAKADIQRDGAYAEYICVKASSLALKPTRLNFAKAASLPTPALSAWQCLFDAADLQEGQRVLIQGAAGGVGHLAVQLAKWKGAKVLATCRSADIEYLEKLGADEVIDFEEVHFEKSIEPVDVVLDTVGGEVMERSYQTLKPRGILVTLIGRPNLAEVRAKGLRAVHVNTVADAGQLTKIASLCDDRTLEPTIFKTLHLSEAKQAHELLDGHKRGKIVLEVVRE
jgi:NADPH:quinone reductase-like Zn-dependent oxidoreductase